VSCDDHLHEFLDSVESQPRRNPQCTLVLISIRLDRESRDFDALYVPIKRHSDRLIKFGLFEEGVVKQNGFHTVVANNDMAITDVEEGAGYVSPTAGMFVSASPASS
jgi:hypothetical protein